MYSTHVRSVEPPGDVSNAADPEADLIARAQRDPEAFAPLYDRYLDPVYRYCFRRLGDREAAEDATSQIFLNALNALPSYRHGGSFRSWLFTIAHNVVTDQYRRQRGMRPINERDADSIDHAPTPEQLVLEAENFRALRALLSQLPTSQRHVVELRLTGLTGLEIARTLGRSHGAVRTLQFRAVARLRELLGVTRAAEDDNAER